LLGSYALSITVPSGWTLITQVQRIGVSTDGIKFYSRTLGSSEPSSWTWTQGAGNFCMWGCVGYSGVSTIGAYGSNEITDILWQAPSVTSTSQDATILSIVFGHSIIEPDASQTQRLSEPRPFGSESLVFNDDIPGYSGISGLRGGASGFNISISTNIVLEGILGAGGITPTIEIGRWKNISPSGVFGQADGCFTQGMMIAPSNSNILYLCVISFDTGSSNIGVWKSTDAGVSWTHKSGNIGAGGPQQPINIAINPSDPNHIYVSDGVRGSANGFWRSFDGGTTWDQPSGFLSIAPTYDVYHVAVDPSDFSHILLSFHSPWPGYDGIASGVLQSTNGGTTWTTVNPPAGMNDSSGCDIDFLYSPNLSIGSSSEWILSTQTDGKYRWNGSSWSKVSTVDMTHGGQQIYYTPDGILYVCGVGGLLPSTDNGLTFGSPTTPNGNILGFAGDGTKLYTFNNGSNQPSYQALISSPSTWEILDARKIFLDGAFQFQYDPGNRILYVAATGSGLWAMSFILTAGNIPAGAIQYATA